MTKTIKKTPATEVLENESTDIIPQEQNLATFNAEAIISQAVAQNVPVETMERLLAMRRELKAEFAKEAFDRAMAGFQAECPVIDKSKAVMNKGGSTVRYHYAPLDVIVTQIKPLLQKYGFSYSFDTSTNGMTTNYCKVTHQLGHSEVFKFEVPIDKDAFMNEQQKFGSANTFGKRYAFLNAFGILTGDEDDDTDSLNSQDQNMPTKSANLKPTEKQLRFIESLARAKGYSMIDIAEMQKKVQRTPTQIIDYLKGCPPKMREDLPVIQQIIPESNGEMADQALSQQEKELVDGIDF